MAKKKLPLSVFEIVWYTICILVGLWGLTYVVLFLVDKYNNLSALHNFIIDFKSTFGLTLYYWGLIIIAIAAIAAVIVLIAYAKVFDKAADREQRRSARLSALKKDNVVNNKPAEVVNEVPLAEAPNEEPADEPISIVVETPKDDVAPTDEIVEEAPIEETKAE